MYSYHIILTFWYNVRSTYWCVVLTTRSWPASKDSLATTMVTLLPASFNTATARWWSAFTNVLLFTCKCKSALKTNVSLVKMFSGKINFVLWLKFHWSLFLCVQLKSAHIKWMAWHQTGNKSLPKPIIHFIGDYASLSLKMLTLKLVKHYLF